MAAAKAVSGSKTLNPFSRGMRDVNAWALDVAWRAWGAWMFGLPAQPGAFCGSWATGVVAELWQMRWKERTRDSWRPFGPRPEATLALGTPPGGIGAFTESQFRRRARQDSVWPMQVPMGVESCANSNPKVVEVIPFQ